MSFVAKNNASSTLAANLSAASTTMQLAAGTGDRFPVIAPGDYTMLVIEDSAGRQEIVKATARSPASVIVTIERAKEGSTALNWVTGDVVECRETAGVVVDAMGHKDSSTGAHAASAISAPAVGELEEGSVASQLAALETGKQPLISALSPSYGGTGATTPELAAEALGFVSRSVPVQTVTGTIISETDPAGDFDLVHKQFVERTVSLRPLVRQTVISSKTDSSNIENYIHGAGASRLRLALDTDEGLSPLALSIAQGFGNSGEPIDESVVFSSDLDEILQEDLKSNTIRTLMYNKDAKSISDTSMLANFHFDTSATVDSIGAMAFAIGREADAYLDPSPKFGTNCLKFSKTTAPASAEFRQINRNPASMSVTHEFFIKIASDPLNIVDAKHRLYSCSMAIPDNGYTYASARIGVVFNAEGTKYDFQDSVPAEPEESSEVCDVDVWNHVAFVTKITAMYSQGVELTTKIWVNGVLSRTIIGGAGGSDNVAARLTAFGGGMFRLDSIGNCGGTTGHVSIDEFAMFSDEQYTVAFTPPAVAYAPTTIAPGFQVNDFPWQYGGAFDRKKNILLRFATASPELEDFGSVWSNYGVSSSSGRGVFDGSTSYLHSTAYSFLGSSEWTAECVVSASLGTASTADTILNFGQSTTAHGLLLELFTNAGATAFNLRLSVSGDGSTWDVASSVLAGTVFPVGSETHVAVCYDGTKYVVYQNGIAVITVTSARRVTNFARARIGASTATTPVNFLNGSVSWFRFINGNALYTGAFTSSLAEPTAVGNVFWFDTSDMVSRKLSVPSEVIGDLPTFETTSAIELGRVISGIAGVDATLQLLPSSYSAFDSSRSINQAKAWVSFDGTGVVSIKAAFNVSSITDNGAGDWTINFTRPMKNNNYMACGNVGYGEMTALAAETAASLLIPRRGSAKGTNSLRIGTVAADYPEVGVVVFGE